MQRFNIPGRVEQSSSLPPTNLFDSEGLVGIDANGDADTPARSITGNALAADQDIRIAADVLTYQDSGSTHTVEVQGNKGVASGYASLDASTKVVENPASATATPTAASIPISDGAGKLAAGWGGAASTLATLDASVELVEKANKVSTDTTADTAGDVRVNGDEFTWYGTGLRAAARYQRCTINCAAPSAVTYLGNIYAQQAMTATRVLVGCTTLPAAPGDSFSFNVRNGNVGDLFSGNQIFDLTPDVTGFAKTQDDEGTFTSYLTEVTGAGTADVAIDTAANGDYLYAGFSDVFGGLQVDMDGANVNAVASVLTAEYWNGSAWSTLTVTDGTDAAGATLGQDGAITWLVPTDWVQREITGLGTKHWVRFSVSAALSAGTAIDNADAIRVAGHLYMFTPDQNTAVAASAELKAYATEADAAAVGLLMVVEGTL
jgi:hypothetical protein